MDRKNKVLHVNVLVVFGALAFTSLCLVTSFNTVRLHFLQNEVAALREQISLTKNVIDKDDILLSRSKRNVIGSTSDGILVRSESYAQQKHLNINRERYPDYKGLSVSYVPAQPSYIGSYPSVNVPTTKKPTIHIRRSRVMNLENTPKVYKDVQASALKSGDGMFESNEHSESSDSYAITRRRKQRMETLDERHPRTGRIKPLPAIHFSGDTSRYVFGTHENFNGGGHLRHPQRTFIDWKANNWVEKTGMDSHFNFEDGYLTIKESGIYFVYAQIYYLDEHDQNGYRVYKNNNTILQCTIYSNSNKRTAKGNTCYTAGAEYLADGDKISLGDLSDGRCSLFEPGKSFFGVIKLGDTKVRH